MGWPVAPLDKFRYLNKLQYIDSITEVMFLANLPIVECANSINLPTPGIGFNSGARIEVIAVIPVAQPAFNGHFWDRRL